LVCFSTEDGIFSCLSNHSTCPKGVYRDEKAKEKRFLAFGSDCCRFDGCVYTKVIPVTLVGTQIDVRGEYVAIVFFCDIPGGLSPGASRSMLTPFIRRPKHGTILFEVIIVVRLLAATLIMLGGGWRDRRLVVAATNDLANCWQTARNTAIRNRAVVSVQPVQSGTIERLHITEDAGPVRGSRRWDVEINAVVDLLGGQATIQVSSSGKPATTTKWKARDGGLTGVVTIYHGWNKVF
jgi:hypothetical protein